MELRRTVWCPAYLTAASQARARPPQFAIVWKFVTNFTEAKRIR